MALELRSAGFGTRLLYCIALFSFLPATLLGSSGWIGLTLGGGGGGLVGQFVFLLVAAAVVFRIYQVARYRKSLDAYVSSKMVATLRALCIVVMLVGGIAGLAIFFIRPLTLLIFKTPGDSGIAFYVVGVYLALIAPFGWKGCLAFEATRWIGSSQYSGARANSPYRWKQDGLVAAVLVTVFVGGAILRWASVKADLVHACKQDRITCVAKVEEHLPRMVSLPMGSPVRLVSNIDSIRMQMRSGDDVKWEVVEGVSNSLKTSGYLPSEDVSLPVMVSVKASVTAEGVLLVVSVAENGEQASWLSALFPLGTRLEKNGGGRLNLLASLPPQSDSLVSNAGASDYHQTSDQLFVFFRRAIVTEVEAQESRVRITDRPQSVKRVTGGLAPSQLPREQSDFACDGHLQKVKSKDVRSFSGASRGWELMELHFAGNIAEAPLTYVDRNDSIVCSPQAIWIVHSVPMDALFTVKRFSKEGKLERFVEGTLPVVAANRIYGRIDDQSLREEHGAVWFDRLETKIEFDHSLKETLMARETFKVLVPPNQVATR